MTAGTEHGRERERATPPADAPDGVARRARRLWDLIGVFVILSGWAYILLGSRAPTDSQPVDLFATMTIEQTPGGQRVARLDHDRWQTAWERMGLPDPPNLDGADPVPLQILMQAADRWARIGDLGALGEVAQVYLALEEHWAALECFAALIRLEPNDPRWHYFLGSEAQSLGLDDLAISSLEESARREPEYPTTYARLGALYLDRGDTDRSSQNYERYRELRPAESLGYVGLGRVALSRGGARKAVQYLRRAAEASPNDYIARRLLARALAAVGMHDESQRQASIAERLPRYAGWLTFDRRLQEAYRLANTQRYLEGQGELAARRGDYRQLVGILRKLVDRRPDDLRSLVNLATAYRQAGALEEAATTVKRGLQRYPRSPELLCVRAEIAFSTRDYELARDDLQQALSVSPKFSRAYDLLGRTLSMQGEHEQAISAMQRAAELDPSSSKVRLALSAMLQRVGRLDEAREILSVLLRNDPDNQAARARLEALPPSDPTDG